MLQPTKCYNNYYPPCPNEDRERERGWQNLAEILNGRPESRHHLQAIYGYNYIINLKIVWEQNNCTLIAVIDGYDRTLKLICY